MDALRINVLVGVDAAGVGRGLATAAASITAFRTNSIAAFNQIGRSIDALGGAGRIGRIGAVGLGFGLVAVGITKALGPAIEFESAFASVLKTVDGTPDQLEQIRTGILDMSQVMPVAATELAEIAGAAGQLGVQAPQVLEFTEVVAQLAATTDLGFEGAARNLARFLNVVDGGVQNVDAASNVLVDLGNNFATTESQILTFATRLGAAFGAAGANQAQIQGLATAYSALGVEAEAGGSALSRVITEISDASKIGGSDLRIFADVAGLLPEEFAAIARENPVEAFRLFNAGLGDILASGQSITPVLEALGLNGIRISRVLTLGATSTNLLTRALRTAEDAVEDGSARQEEYARRAETTASRLQILENRLKALAISAGTPALAGFALILDAIGDAAVSLGTNLAPLGNQLVALFENAAGAAGIFFDAIGSPALQAAAAGLIGISTALGAVLAGLNALGPLGFLIAGLVADLALVGPITSAAVVAIDKFAASVYLLGIRAGVSGVAMRAFTLALTASPFVLAGIAMVSLGAAIVGAKEAAEAAAKAFREDLNEAIDTGRYEEIADSISTVRDRIRELEEVDAVPDGLATSFDGWRASITSVGQLLTPFTENTIYNARQEAAALREELDNAGFEGYGIQARSAAGATGGFEARLTALSGRLGLSKDATLSLVNELGLFDQVFGQNAQAALEAGTALEEYAGRAALAANFQEDLYQKVIDGTASLSDYAALAGITDSALLGLASAVDAVDLDDIDADDAADRLALLDAITESVGVQFTELTRALGLTTNQYLEQVQALNALSEANSRLTDAISASQQATEQMQFAQQFLSDSTATYNTALDALISGEGERLDNLIGLGTATADLIRAESAHVDSIDGVRQVQADLTAQFVQTATEAGFTATEILEITSSILAIPTSTLIEIFLANRDAQAAVDELGLSLSLVERDWLVQLGIIDEATPTILGALEFLRQYGNDEESYTATLAAADAGSLGLITASQQLADDFEDTEAEAELSVEAQEAINTIESVRQSITELTAAEYIAFLLANGVGAEEATALTREFIETNIVDPDFIATLTSNPDSALADIAFTAEQANDYAAADYLSFLTTDNSNAVEQTDEAQGRADDFVGGSPYGATATMNSSDAQTKLDSVNRSTGQYSGGSPYNATLTARDNGAGSTIDGLVKKLGGFVSKSITLTTYTRTVSSGGGGGTATFSADGSVSAGGTFYAGGPGSGVGVFSDEALGRFQTTSNRHAGIFPAVSPGRIFAEPATGGEAFIPLDRAKRVSALRVFNETGRRLGVFEDGGIIGALSNIPRAGGSTVAAININVPVTINASSQGGMDAAELAALAGREVNRAMSRVSRELAQIR